MAYGTIKVDNITFDNGGVDKLITVSGLFYSTSGALTVTGTISGGNVTAPTATFTTLTGTTTTGTTATFTSGSFTTLTGTTVTGTTANFVSGVFTTQVSGTTITGTTVATTTGSFVSLTGTTATFTSGIIASGTAALPSLAILSDPNTGIYSPGADQLAISTSGVGRLFVNSNGDIGLGTSSPDVFGRFYTRAIGLSSSGSTSLQINAATGSNAVIDLGVNSARTAGITSNVSETAFSTLTATPIILSTNSSERLRITSAGLVGVGTSSPGSRLSVEASSSDTTPLFTSLGSINGSEGAIFLRGGSTAGYYYDFKRSGTTGFLEIQGNQTGFNNICLAPTSGSVGVGTSSPVTLLEVKSTTTNSARLRVTGTGTTAGNFRGFEFGNGSIFKGGFLQDESTDLVSIFTPIAGQAVNITSAGNVGVGTTTPQGKLIVSNGGANGLEFFPDTDSGVNSTINSYNRSSSAFSALTINAAQHIFLTASSEAARIDSSGRLGIGTSTFSYLANKLVIDKGSTANDGITIVSSNTSNACIWFADGTTGSEAYRGGIDYNHSTDKMQIYTGAQGNITIDSSGRLGIGTTSPSEILHVNGNIMVSWGAYRIASTFDDDYRQGLAFDSSNRQLRIFSTTNDSGGSIGFYTRVGAGSSDTDYGTERARIDSSGRLLVGTSSSPSVGDSQYSYLVVQGYPGGATGNANISLQRGETAANITSDEQIGDINFTDSAGYSFAKISCLADANAGTNDYPGRLVFSTTADGAPSPTERMRIDSAGNTRFNSASFSAAADPGIKIISSTTIPEVRTVVNTSDGGITNYSFYNTNATYNGYRFYVKVDGGIANHSVNNVNLSDRNAKKDISPASSTWNCVKEWEIVNYLYKNQPANADLNLGVIAQQVAESCPEVITVFQEAKEATEDQPAQEERLGVKEQQMYWMAIKALQEAIARIETLETEVAALKGA